MLLSACRAHAVAQTGVTNGDALGNGLVVSTLREVNTSWRVEECWCLCSLCVVTQVYVFLTYSIESELRYQKT